MVTVRDHGGIGQKPVDNLIGAQSYHRGLVSKSFIKIENLLILFKSGQTCVHDSFEKIQKDKMH